MKLYRYTYYLPYGDGCGVVLAESKNEAKKMILERPYAIVRDLEIKEIDMSKKQILDHSWSE
jgi:hypothetical protein